ncbi:hypothetical protein HHI36_014769 [Cryptolaemus montrouzieri]|uniref:Uncharacterized protein n=1 Tax=Cryptolaemus montrouzieri TaxID=559131 RepID=A0ABD2N4L0_9CUCU
MGTNLKLLWDIALKIVIEKRVLPKIKWEDGNLKKKEIKDLTKLIQNHWCNEISSMALKVLKEKQWQKPNLLPLAEDIENFRAYVSDLANSIYIELQGKWTPMNYRTLTECVLALTVMFNRKRIGDVLYLDRNLHKKRKYFKKLSEKV